MARWIREMKMKYMTIQNQNNYQLIWNWIKDWNGSWSDCSNWINLTKYSNRAEWPIEIDEFNLVTIAAVKSNQSDSIQPWNEAYCCCSIAVWCHWVTASIRTAPTSWNRRLRLLHFRRRHRRRPRRRRTTTTFSPFTKSSIVALSTHYWLIARNESSHHWIINEEI